MPHRIPWAGKGPLRSLAKLAAIFLCFAAAATASAWGQSDPPDIGAALHAPQAAERETALDRLAEARDRWPDVVLRVAQLLDDPDLAVAGKAARLLGQMGTPAFPAISDVLASGSAQQRWGATVAL